MKERVLIPEYSEEDARGLYASSEEGKWRPLDIQDGRLIVLNSLVLKDRAMHRARIAGRANGTSTAVPKNT